MDNVLSIRSYALNMCRHVHAYHQIVLPLNGYIEIEVGDYKGTVCVAEAVLIKAAQLHSFRAFEAARFIVADMSELPDNLISTTHRKFPIHAPLLAFSSRFTRYFGQSPRRFSAKK